MLRSTTVRRCVEWGNARNTRVHVQIHVTFAFHLTRTVASQLRKYRDNKTGGKTVEMYINNEESYAYVPFETKIAHAMLSMG